MKTYQSYTDTQFQKYKELKADSSFMIRFCFMYFVLYMSQSFWIFPMYFIPQFWVVFCWISTCIHTNLLQAMTTCTYKKNSHLGTNAVRQLKNTALAMTKCECWCTLKRADIFQKINGLAICILAMAPHTS